MTTRIEVTPSNQQTRTGTFRKLLWATPLAMLVSSIANLILYFVVGALIPAVSNWPGAGPAQIIGANIVYLFIGAIVLAIINRVSSHPVRHFRIVATVGLVLSMFLPLSAWMGFGAADIPAPNAVTAITLGLMHVVSYAISVPMFTRLVLGKQVFQTEDKRRKTQKVRPLSFVLRQNR